MAENRPNVLLIVVDQMRREALGLNGRDFRVHTPHLDQLAREGINFTHACSACPSCIAARAGLMTGLEPFRHGFTGYDARPEWRYPVTLPRTFTQAGYQTWAVGKMHVQPARATLGFEHVVLHDGYLHDKRRYGLPVGDLDDYLPWLHRQRGPGADLSDSGLGCNGYAARVWPWPEEQHPTEFVVSESIEFLRRRDPTRPFFLMASFHRPHSPLDPPATFWDMYRDLELPEPLCGDWVDFPLSCRGGAENPVVYDRIAQDRARKAYYALISHIDYALNRLFMILGDRGLWDNTAIAFVSDHGDMLFDHHQVRKAVPLAGSSGVPLFLRLPRTQQEGRCGLSDSRPAELRDLFPTLCEICGIPVPAGLDGESLLRPQPLRRELHGEHAYGELSHHYLTDSREKYCWFSKSGRELLFDLEADPGECHDLSRQQPGRLAAWRARLAERLRDRPEGFVAEGELVAGRSQSSSQAWAGIGR